MERGNGNLACMWKRVQGYNSWQDLLDPISPILKAEILRYGEFAQLCYRAFDPKRASEKYGGCKGIKESLLSQSGSLSKCGYVVTEYIYAKTLSLRFLFGSGEEPNDRNVWIGFIAICTDPDEIRRLGRRDIVVAWRGTKMTEEWIQNLKDILSGDESWKPHVRVHKGFLDCYESAKHIVRKEITRLLKEYRGEELSVTFTGHSLGGALATLSAYDIKQILKRSCDSSTCRDDFSMIPVTAFTFGSPRVGNEEFRKHVEEIGLKVLRMRINDDVVTKIPGVLVNENAGCLKRALLTHFRWAYYHVGTEICLDYDSSPSLNRKESSCRVKNLLSNLFNLINFHSLEVYLHLLDGFHGNNLHFKSSQRGIRYITEL